MKYIFVHPSGSQYWKVQLRYTAYKKALYQRYKDDAILLESRIFLGKTSDTGLLCSDADIIIININACQQVGQLIQHWKARDKIVIIDLSTSVVLDNDRHQYQLGPTMIASDIANHIPEALIDKERLIWMLKLADGVITNSRQMMEDWSGIVKVLYIPDFIDLDQYLIHPFESHQGIQIGIKVCDGGVKKLAETGLLPALEEIGNRYSHVRMIIFGEHPQFAHMLKIPPTQKWFIPPLEIALWQSVLPTLDIGILPKTNAFDLRCGREDVLELMTMKIPWIASDGMWCHELRRYGWLVQNKTGAWERILDDMICNLDTYHNEISNPIFFPSDKV